MKNCIIILVVLINSSAFAQIHERWDVKTITDGFTPDFHSVKKITVASIEPKAKIPVRNTQPRLNFEKQMVSVTGTISRRVLESDGDYHMEITDGTMDDSTLVCEAVSPALQAASGSPMVAYYRQVYALAKNLKTGDKVTFTGLLFQDKFHKPSPHRTRNFVEIHPVLIASKIN